MQRRKFIQLSALSGAALGISGISCGHRHQAYYNLLEKPAALSQICDLRTIRDIGMEYSLQAPAEAKAEKLETLLMTDSAGKPVSPDANAPVIQTLLEEKIKHDFETGDTVIVKGWVLAVTEARQCTLLFLHQQ